MKTPDTAAIVDPPRTHNEPPLDQLLIEESAEMRARAATLVEQTTKATVTNEETRQNTTVLAGIIRDHLSLIEKTREERKAPFLTAGRTVDAHFSGIAATLATFDPKKKLIGGPLQNVMTMLDEYRRAEEAKVEAERQRLEEEALHQRLAAAAAAVAQREAEERERIAKEEADRRVREAEAAAANARTAAQREKARREAAEADAARQREAAAARQRQMDAEVEQRRRTEEAERLERQAEETQAAPMTTAYGIRGVRRTVWKMRITDLTAALRHARKVNEASVLACVQTIFEAQVRAGVRSLPGAEVTEDSATTIRTKG